MGGYSISSVISLCAYYLKVQPFSVPTNETACGKQHYAGAAISLQKLLTATKGGAARGGTPVWQSPHGQSQRCASAGPGACTGGTEDSTRGRGRAARVVQLLGWAGLKLSVLSGGKYTAAVVFYSDELYWMKQIGVFSSTGRVVGARTTHWL